MRLLSTYAAIYAVAALAANTDAGQASDDTPSEGVIATNVADVSGGQIALSARNEGDGTWSVRLGPGGPILMDGLPQEKALGIVGAPTAPYEPTNQREQDLADLREQCEEAAKAYANENALNTDEDAGLVDKNGKRRFADEPEAQRIGPAAGARKSASNTSGGKAKNGEA